MFYQNCINVTCAVFRQYQNLCSQHCSTVWDCKFPPTSLHFEIDRTALIVCISWRGNVMLVRGLVIASANMCTLVEPNYPSSSRPLSSPYHLFFSPPCDCNQPAFQTTTRYTYTLSSLNSFACLPFHRESPCWTCISRSWTCISSLLRVCNICSYLQPPNGRELFLIFFSALLSLLMRDKSFFETFAFSFIFYRTSSLYNCYHSILTKKSQAFLSVKFLLLY